MEKEIKTGYPHIDKPWRQYYDKSFYQLELPEQTILEYMKMKNKGNEDGTAISFYKKETSYGELYDSVDDASRVLSSLGISEEDRIMYMLANLPQTASLFYGSSQIGAVSDYIDPRPESVDLATSAQKILTMVDEEKIKQLIVLDQCYLGLIAPIENELKELGMSNIVTVSPSSSMDTKAKLRYLEEIAKFKGVKELKKELQKMKYMAEKIEEVKKSSVLDVLDYNELVKNSQYSQFNKVGYNPNRIEAIVHTSGTSNSKPKPIPLTTDNLNNYVHQTYGANMVMEKGDRALHILPYFAAFGLVDVVHAGLCHGCNLVQIPEFAPVNFGKLILKYKPQIIIGTPTWFLTMINDPILKHADLSFLKMVTYGGDSMEISDIEKVNKFLVEHKCSIEITTGHGMSETCGCGSYAVGEYNKKGSIGIPMPDTIYSVINPETKELVKFGPDDEYIEGEFIISSKSATPGVLDGKIITPRVQYDGLDFIYTKDIGRMYKDGVMEFLSRSDRSFTRFDGYKVKCFEIEKIIKSNSKVKYCVVSPYFDESKFGNMPIVDIVMEGEYPFTDDEKVEIVKEIVNEYFIKNKDVSSRQLPSRFRFRNEMPMTKNGKVDFNSLKAEGETNCDVVVDMEETTISIGNINIYACSSQPDRRLKLS